MTSGGLHDPLGTRKAASRSALAGPMALRIVAVAAMAGLVAGLVVLFDGPGGGGEPFAVATIERPEAAAPAGEAKPPAVGPPVASLTKAPDGGNGGASQDVEIQNGVRIIRPATLRSSATQVIKVVPESGTALSPVPDPRLVEPGPYGPLPRIGPDGARPSEIYARPAGREAGSRAGPRVAILIGGMGLDRAATQDAALATPPAVTFGFAPYGPDLEAQVRKAREAGHEIVLQLPMEDVEGTGGDLSHRLSTGKPGNADRLKWLLARCTGYAGVANYLGGRFLADEQALAPVLRDLSARGLFFVDDGSARRSLAPALADETGLPVLRADIVLDANPAPASIAAALTRLESIARERGLAVGTASALPATIALVARFAETLKSEGIVLVPVSEAVAHRLSGLAKTGRP